LSEQNLSYAVVPVTKRSTGQKRIADWAKATEINLLLSFNTPSNAFNTTPEVWRFGHRRNLTMKKIFAAAAVAAVLGLAACGQPATNAADTANVVDAAAGNVVDAAADAAANTVDAAAGAATDAAAATGNVVDAAADMTGNAVEATANTVDAAAGAAVNAVAPEAK
jgi:hypothetical protein